MKKNLFATLLALVMVLSLAPVSLADCAHEHTYTTVDFDDWNTVQYTSVDNMYHDVTGLGTRSTYCQDCDELLETEEHVQCTERWSHTYDDTGDTVCTECGHQNTCPHENTYNEWSFDNWDTVVYTSVDDQYHTVTGDGKTYDYCEDCGEWVNVVKVPNMTQTMYHDYDANGVCDQCGHENACAHANTYSDWSFDDWDTVIYTSVDDKYHTATGDGETYDYCEDCGEWVNVVKVPNMTQTMYHDYDANGVCEQCGHENACTHENVIGIIMNISFSDEDKWTYTSVDNRNHVVHGPGEIFDYCQDCGLRMNVVAVADVNFEDPHTFDENGICSECGASKMITIYPICEVFNDEDKLVFFNNGVLYYVKEGGETLHGWWRLPDGKLKVHLDVPGKVARANGLVVKIGIAAYTITEEQMAELIRCLDVE